MKLTALSLAAAFAFFVQTMAETLPQDTPDVLACPVQTFHCRSSTNILVNVTVLILTDLRRRRSMCKLIIPCEVAVRLYIDRRWVLL